jgi:ketosteroid isomerase-like protein
MSMESNKRTAAEFFAHISAGDIPGALGLLTDDVTWRIAGKPELTPAAGTYDKTRLDRLFHRMLRRLDDGLKMTVQSAIAEGDKVAVEVTSRGKLDDGRAYEQEYHFLLEFRGGRIAAVREYLDTQHAHAVWF